MHGAMTYRCLSLACLILIACGDDAESNEGDHPDACAPGCSSTDDAATEDGSAEDGSIDDAAIDAAGPIACELLDQPGCIARDADCQVVSAAPVQEDGGAAESIFITCLPDDDACSDGDAERCASQSADSPLYRFPTRCIPPSWVDRGSECDL
jgi:hypothetical protein